MTTVKLPTPCALETLDAVRLPSAHATLSFSVYARLDDPAERCLLPCEVSRWKRSA